MLPKMPEKTRQYKKYKSDHIPTQLVDHNGNPSNNETLLYAKAICQQSVAFSTE
jgi:hypothetical protein